MASESNGTLLSDSYPTLGDLEKCADVAVLLMSKWVQHSVSTSSIYRGLGANASKIEGTVAHFGRWEQTSSKKFQIRKLLDNGVEFQVLHVALTHFSPKVDRRYNLVLPYRSYIMLALAPRILGIVEQHRIVSSSVCSSAIHILFGLSLKNGECFPCVRVYKHSTYTSGSQMKTKILQMLSELY